MKKIGLLIWHTLVNAQKGFLIASSCFLILLLTGEVIMRYLIHYPGMEVEEIATLVAFWLYFIGASYGTYDRSHIKVEIFHLILKNPRKLAIAKTSATLIALALSGLMVYWGFHYFLWGITKGERSRVLLLPMVFSQTSIFFGGILMFLYFLTELIDRFLQALGRAPKIKREE